jgi:hypothetical protein
MKIQVARCIALLLVLALGCAREHPKSDETKTTTASPKGDEMTATKTKQVWNAYIETEDDNDRLAGQLAVENGMLSMVSAETDKDREYLEGVVEDMNAREHLMDLAPPKDPDAERFSLGANIYKRDHPDFEKVLVRKLKEYHYLRVEPAK